ncbi:MAG: molybdopterin-dependent oxidoreductase [Alphaproteobacteria bacterium]|nr:molybdopterin-dependent oxidoreductase [Alphaproteobacteria bacterium]
MAEIIASYSRATEALEGVRVSVEGGRIVGFEGDTANPKSAGFVSPLTVASAALPHHPDRLTTPLKREGGRLVEASWDEALDAIGQALAGIRRAHGPRAVGLYAGYPVACDHLGAVRTAALALHLDTPNLFTPLAMWGAARLMAAELVTGAPMPLQADVGRAHYTVLLGADQDDGLWGPLQLGNIHGLALDYFRNRRKQNKLVAVDPRRTPQAAGADEHLRIRPGTEVFFLLGLAHSVLFRHWTDQQYLDDYCVNIDRLRRWLEPWTPARCAAICDVDPGELAGVALRFARSAMATVAISPLVIQGPHATVACWAWLVVHALTANLLRPGGLFEAQGLIDLQPILASFPTDRAPTTRVHGLPNLLMQAPATTLAREILEPGDGQVRALLALDGCPIADLPQPGRVADALESLELLVAFDHLPSETTARAHWVLPGVHFWERADLHLLDHAALPTRFMQATPAVLQPPAQARTLADTLAELAKRVPVGLSLRGTWGRHLRLTGRYLASAPLEPWVDRVLDWSGLPPLAELQALPGGLDRGELNRAVWRPTTENEKLDLAPERLEAAVLALSVPTVDPDFPLSLITAVNLPTGRGARLRVPDAQEPGVRVHPDTTWVDGAAVIVETPYGRAEGVIRHDPTLRSDTVIVPWGWAVDAGRLLDADTLDPFSGTVAQSGVPCRLREA